MINPSDQHRNVSFRSDTFVTMFGQIYDSVSKLTDPASAEGIFYDCGCQSGYNFGRRLQSSWDEKNEYLLASPQEKLAKWCEFDSNVHRPRKRLPRRQIDRQRVLPRRQIARPSPCLRVHPRLLRGGDRRAPRRRRGQVDLLILPPRQKIQERVRVRRLAQIARRQQNITLRCSRATFILQTGDMPPSPPFRGRGCISPPTVL